MNKPPLLYLVHRIPYPPNKGDKIRSFNLLKELSKDFDIHLGCFIDDPFDWKYVSELSQWCRTVYCEDQSKLVAKLKGLTSFLTFKPITLPYYASNNMQRWVHQVIDEHQIQQVLVFSSSMAQFVDHSRYNHLNRVIDFVDIDSDKWRQYALKQKGVMRWVYQREHALLQAYEQGYCERFNASLFVSPDEAHLFRTMMPEKLANKIDYVLNGVDIEFFNPEIELPDAIEMPVQSPALVFTGAMDYWANVDAVIWFCQQVWPSLKAKQPKLHFYIVGGNPTSEVKALAALADVHVTGRVHDVRPFIRDAAVVVAPLQIARGIQNKVLEAMAMNKPIVATHMAMEGINSPNHADLLQTDDATEFETAILSILKREQPIDCPNRRYVIDHFTWPATLQQLKPLLQRMP